MKKYLYYYPNHTALESSTDQKNIHNVIYCDNETHVHYDYHDYSKDYFTTEILENGTISFNILNRLGTSAINSISYSKDNGETWITTNNTDNKSENLVINVQVNEGDNVLWKGDATRLALFYDEDGYGSFFSSTCEFNVMGNIMSLLYGDNFIGQTELFDGGEFSTLFYDAESESGCTNLISAKNLIMPFSTATWACCYQMFSGCTSLTIAPSVLSATTLERNCYGYMFNGCTNLTVAPQLPATTLASYCYAAMFINCTNLTVAPELPATVLADNCYYGMFQYCTSLITAPELPATTLESYCYFGMFRNCTSLTTAPVLPATTLVNSCYNGMFRNCTNLNYIKAMFTTTPSNSYMYQWVSGVTANGTFVKNAAAEWNDISIIPSGWTIQTANN